MNQCIYVPRHCMYGLMLHVSTSVPFAIPLVLRISSLWLVYPTQYGQSTWRIRFAVDREALTVDYAIVSCPTTTRCSKFVIELSGPSSALRLNGIPQPIEDLERRDPTSYFISQQMFQDASSMAEQSFHTQSSIATMATSTSKASTIAGRPQLARTLTFAGEAQLYLIFLPPTGTEGEVEAG